nr:MAG TPA: hypothetical protein [Caudoviricetes sp.]
MWHYRASQCHHIILLRICQYVFATLWHIFVDYFHSVCYSVPERR